MKLVTQKKNFYKSFQVSNSKYDSFCITRFCNSKIPSLPFVKQKSKPNQKWKIPHTILERRILCFSLYNNCELKIKLWWVGARESKESALFPTFVLCWGNFCNVCMYFMVLGKLPRGKFLRRKSHFSNSPVVISHTECSPKENSPVFINAFFIHNSLKMKRELVIA